MNHTFTFHNPLTHKAQYFLLDVESGAIHELDAAAYGVASALENGEGTLNIKENQEEIQEVLDEFQELREAGLFDSAERVAPSSEEASPVIKSMCLHVAHDCNLRCKYCFAGTGEFHGQRMLMPLEIGKAALDFLLSHSGKRRTLEVDLFGGEPLMNFDMVKELVAYGRRLERRHQKTINFTITTNGLALDEESIAFINKEMHNVVFSLDGRQAVHDAVRPTINGKGSYALVLPKTQMLSRLRGDKQQYVRGTFTSANLDFTEDVRALRDAGFEQISIEPVVLEEGSPFAIRAEHVPRILQEYDALVEFCARSEQEGKWFNFFHFMLDMEEGPCLQKRIKGCGAGTEYIAVSPDGDIYPCHQFVGEEAFKLGNVLENTYDSHLRSQFSACSIRTKAACRDCWAKYFCSGGCAANAWKFHGDIMIPENITCVLLCKRTECAIGLAMLKKAEENNNEENAG